MQRNAKRSAFLPVVAAVLQSLFGTAHSAPGNQRVVIDSGVVERRLVVRDGRLTTEAFTNAVTGARLVPRGPGEFAIALWEGLTLTDADYRVSEHRSQHQQREQAVQFLLEGVRPGLPRVTVEYRGRRGDHFLRKRLVVEAEAVVDWIAVEAIPVSARAELGGFGQPVYVDAAWFAGLEHPAATNEIADGRLACWRYVGKKSFATPWAVVGGIGIPGGRIDEEFQHYLASVRRPARLVLQYNTWFDRRGSDVRPDSLHAAFTLLQGKLLVPYGLTLDAFVIDDGYQNPASLWGCSAHWPEGLGPFARQLEAQGARLGLWLPLNGCGLDTDWGLRQGYERSDHPKQYYCLAGRRYQDEIRRAVQRHLSDGNLAYLKHDFNFLRCGASGHEHPATDRHGLAANVDAQIELLRHERRQQPEALLGVTSGIWPSPWWLLVADFLWMGGADHQYEWRNPCSSRRAAEITYRDARLHRLLRLDKAQIPPAALMTHGLIRGRYAGHDPRETLEEWSDYVVMHFGRGTLLGELYISPEWMPDDFWPVLGRAAQWAKANELTLQHTAMVGGRPDRAEPYGYVHWSAAKGIACLRNPAVVPTTFELGLTERPRRLPSVTRWHPLVIYPYRQRLPAIGSAESLPLSLPAESVVLVELYASLPVPLEALPARRFAVRQGETGAALAVFAEEFPPAVRTRRRDDDLRKEWSGSFQLDTAGAIAVELAATRSPAGGVELEVVPSTAPASHWQRRREHDDWDTVKTALDLGDRPVLDLRAWLPPSPFCPERPRATVMLRLTTKPTVELTIPLRDGASVPPWPLALQEERSVDEVVLLDDKTFDRRRSLGESLAWIMALGVLPFVAVDLVAHRWNPAARPLTRRLFRITVLGALALLYALSPLGTALARALL